MNTFAWIIAVATILLMPLISLFYVYLRLAARASQLGYLFNLPGILRAYLASKGLDVSPSDEEKKKEKEQEYLKRLRDEFQLIFKTEFKSEYGQLRYLLAITVGSSFTGLVILYLARSSFGKVLIGAPNALPSPIQLALLGAFAWNLWLLFSGYDMLDLIPSTFYWITFRYVVAIMAGILAPQIFRDSGVANIFALTAAVVPYPRLLDFLRSKVPGLKEAHVGEPPIWKIQGMQQATIDRLETLGIYTTQELAYVDPLMLLFRTHFQPKVVIDWIDQSLLYNYVGERINNLRTRGIRGSIELSGLRDDDPALDYVAEVLNIKRSELQYFRNKLLNDYQVKLISTLWDQFKPQDLFTAVDPAQSQTHSIKSEATEPPKLRG
jgi:hypothetical protein